MPLMMVDSGHQFSSGNVNFQTVYSGLVNAELPRPPQAQITAFFSRSGNHFDVRVTVTNTAGLTLDWNTNGATVHLVVYQQDDTVQSGHLTRRYAMAAVYQNINNLANGDSGEFMLTTPDLSGVNWDHLHLLALVDYRPAGTVGTAYDMLQATLAVPPPVVILIKYYLPLMVR